MIHSTRKRKTLVMVFSLLTILSFSSCSKKENTLTEDVKEVGNDISRAGSKAVNDVKDETCEMVNGKMECAAKEVGHSIENTTDKVKDAVD